MNDKNQVANITSAQGHNQISRQNSVSSQEYEIISRLKLLQNQEDEIVKESIDLLFQIEKKKVFLKLGYASLYDFCLQELKYSAGSAYRRISAMRLIKEVPEIKERVEANIFSLSTLAQVHTFIKKKEKEEAPLSKNEKLELLAKVENLSTRDCEREILKLDPKAHKPDRAIQVNQDLTEIRLTVDAEFMSALNRLRARLSNRGLLENKDLIFHAIKTELTRLDRNPKEVSVITQLAKNNVYERRGRIVIPHSLRALVYAKSAGECSYVDPTSQRKCSSQHFLQIDHIIPVSAGGTNNLNNLQLMCGAHNRLKADRV